MSTLEWSALLRLGLQGLRLTPEQFWALTPAELQLMLGQSGGPAPLRRADLEALERAFPDTGHPNGKGRTDDR